MRKFLAMMLVVLTGVVSSCQYDDDELWDSVNDLAARVSALENLTKQMNGDISAVQGIVSALEKNVSVSSVESLTDGYVIHFSDGTKAVIKNGADGKDGAAGTDGKDGKDGLNAPVINIAKEGGVYYWTITTDGTTTWLLDEDGKKLPVSGKKGANGAPGMPGAPGANGNDGITPLLKVDTEGYWMVSYDKGVTYDYVKNANGEKVSALGQSGNAGSSGAGGTGTTTGWLQFDQTAPVKDNGDGTITIKMADGTEFVLAKGSSVVYKMGTTVLESTQNLSLGASGLVLTYEVTKIENPSVEILKAENVEVTVNKANSTLSIKQETGKTDGKLVIMFYNDGQNVISVLTFDSSALASINDVLIQAQADTTKVIAISSITGENNVIKLPAAVDGTTRTFKIGSVDTSASSQLVIKDLSGSGEYQGEVIVELENGADIDKIDVQLPGATVKFIGQAGEVIASTKPNTFIVGEGSEITTLTINQGNVVIEAGATVGAINNNATGNTITAHVTTVDELNAAIAKGYNVILDTDITAFDIIVIDKPITLDGNGHTLTSSAGRAINVSGADANGVTIKNLIIEASDERAINIIGNATNVTIDNVTATAANYAVNVAKSAPAAKVVINNSILTGLNVVNVASEGANITIDKTTLVCNDQNTAENYAALVLNADAKNAKITVTDVIFDIKGDSKQSSNGAYDEGGVITINGEVVPQKEVARITYPGPYYYSFETLQAAVTFAKSNDKIQLISDVTLTESLEIPEGKTINLDLNGKTIKIDAAGDEVIDFINRGVLNIYGGYIVAAKEEASRRCIYNYGTMTIGQEGVEDSGVTFTQTYELKGAAINNEGTMTIHDATVTAKAFSIWNSGTNARLEVKGGSYKTKTTGTTGETAYYVVRNQNGATMTIDDGDFEGNEGVISVIGGVVQLNDGTYKRTGIEGVSGHTIYVESGTLKYVPSTCDIINENTSAGSQEIYKGTNGVVENLM